MCSCTAVFGPQGRKARSAPPVAVGWQQQAWPGRQLSCPPHPTPAAPCTRQARVPCKIRRSNTLCCEVCPGQIARRSQNAALHSRCQRGKLASEADLPNCWYSVPKSKLIYAVHAPLKLSALDISPSLPGPATLPRSEQTTALRTQHVPHSTALPTLDSPLLAVGVPGASTPSAGPASPVATAAGFAAAAAAAAPPAAAAERSSAATDARGPARAACVLGRVPEGAAAAGAAAAAARSESGLLLVPTPVPALVLRSAMGPVAAAGWAAPAAEGAPGPAGAPAAAAPAAWLLALGACAGPAAAALPLPFAAGAAAAAAGADGAAAAALLAAAAE